MDETYDFKEIYEEFKPRLLRYLTRLAGPNEAEDLAQEVFKKVSGGLKDFRGETKLSAWIYRIATNAAIDRLRSSSFKRTIKYNPLEDRAGVEDWKGLNGQRNTATDQEIVRKEMGECVREFIDKLPPDYRTVIILSELEGLRNKEIADILQVSLHTVKIRLHRARGRLKKELEEGCDFYHNEENILACDRRLTSIKEPD